MSFREWTQVLRDVRGNQPMWPWLLGQSLSDEFQRQMAVDDAYQEEVFKDRDDHEYKEGTSERRQVATLYHRCLTDNAGCLLIGEEPFWLLGYEWPNQGGNAEMGRRADLVCMATDGSLVVFECKRADNSDPPITAVVEGLDYLACLLREENFEKIDDGFTIWSNKPGKECPGGFEGVKPSRDQQPTIVVLAPDVYFSGRYTRSCRGSGWADLSVIGDDVAPGFRIGFAASDFRSCQAHWI